MIVYQMILVDYIVLDLAQVIEAGSKILSSAIHKLMHSVLNVDELSQYCKRSVTVRILRKFKKLPVVSIQEYQNYQLLIRV
jgi:hypothetical protein